MSGGSSRAFYQFSRDVYPSISSSLLYLRRDISRGLVPMKRNGHLKRASERRSAETITLCKRGMERQAISTFLLSTRVIPKRVNSAETEDIIPPCISWPHTLRPHTPARACVHLGRRKSWTTRASIVHRRR